MVTAKPITHFGPLSRWELATLCAAFAGLFPRNAHEAIPLCADDVDAEPALQSLLAVAPARAVWGVRAAIVLCALAPLVVLGRFRTLTGLEPEARTLVMATLLASPFYPVRQLAMLVKMMGSFVFARAPEVRAVMLRARTIPVPIESGTRLIGAGSLLRHGRTAVRDEHEHEHDLAHVLDPTNGHGPEQQQEARTLTGGATSGRRIA